MLHDALHSYLEEIESAVHALEEVYMGVRLILRSKLGKMAVNEECPEMLPAIA
jgi:hypothetical protein